MEIPEEQIYETQKSITRTANRALGLSILYLGGIGSIFAVYFAIKTLTQLKHAGFEARGKGKAIFALCIGVIGFFHSILLWSNLFINNPFP